MGKKAYIKELERDLEWSTQRVADLEEAVSSKDTLINDLLSILDEIRE
jgi:hypothetical protein